MKTLGRIKARILPILVGVLWYLKLDSLIARLFAVMIIHHNQRKGTLSPAGGNSLLVMAKMAFNDDIAMLRMTHSDYLFLDFPVSLRLLLLKVILPPIFREQKKYYPELHNHRVFLERISRLFGTMFAYMRKSYGCTIRAVLSSGLDVGHEYPLIKAIHAAHGKFIALNKESNIYSSEHKEDRIALYRRYQFAFDGDLVLFYNKLAEDTCLEAGVVSPDHARVTGSPRVDALVRLGEGSFRSVRPYILLASFCEEKVSAKTAPKLWNEVMAIIAHDALLREHVVVKCRDPREAAMVERSFPGIRAVVGPLVDYLAERPCLFVGWNSGACLDAMIASVPVLVPWWSDGERAAEAALLGPHTAEFHLLVRNPEEFRQRLRSALAGQKIVGPAPDWRENPALRKFLEEHYAPLDGKNTERVWAELRRVLA